MACTYIIQQNAAVPCILDIIEDNGFPPNTLYTQINLRSMNWVEKSDDNIEIADCCGNLVNLDIDSIPAYATVALLIAFLEPLRLAYDPGLGPVGPPAPAPTAGTAGTDYFTTSLAATIAAGFQSVSFLNVGTANGTIDMGSGLDTVIPGQTVEFKAILNPVTGVYGLSPAFPYSAVGTTFAIATIL